VRVNSLIPRRQGHVVLYLDRRVGAVIQHGDIAGIGNRRNWDAHHKKSGDESCALKRTHEHVIQHGIRLAMSLMSLNVR
jgi:hypothetical protein